MDKMSISERVKAEAARCGISLESLADKLGIDYSTLWRRCNGRIRLDVKFLEKIAEALDISPSYLLDGSMIAEISSDDETNLLFLYRSLSNEKKEQILRIMRAL